MPIKYAVDSVSLPDTQQSACDLLAEGGKLITFLPPSAKTTKGKEIFHAMGFLRIPANLELLEIFYHDNLERLLKEGAIKVSRSRHGKCLFCVCIDYLNTVAKPSRSTAEWSCGNTGRVEAFGGRSSVPIEVGR